MTKQFTNVNDFVNWVVSIGYWQNFQSWLYANGHAPIEVYRDHRIGIGLWNEYLGYDGSPTEYAHVPEGIVPKARYVVSQYLKHYVASKHDYDYYQITAVTSTEYEMVDVNHAKYWFKIVDVDNDTNWELTFGFPTPEPPPPEPPPPGPPPPEPPPPEPPPPGPPSPGGGGSAMAVVACLIILACSAKPRRKVKRRG